VSNKKKGGDMITEDAGVADVYVCICVCVCVCMCVCCVWRICACGVHVSTCVECR